MAQSKPKKLRDKILCTFVEQLKQSRFYTNNFLSSFNECIETLKGRRKINSIICYGLGSFCNGVDIASRYQLALLILIYQQLTELSTEVCETIEVFDPSFESLDRDTLLSFKSPKFALIEENEHCARKLDCDNPEFKNKVSLIYMPHLDKYFYNNILGSNWCQRGLGSLLILGNSFHEMIDNEIVTSKLKSELYYINTLVSQFDKFKNKNVSINNRSKDQKEEEEGEALIEIKIDDSTFEHSDIFNNLAFHSIDDIWLQKNANKIHQSRRKDWQRFVSSPEESLMEGSADDWNDLR